MNFECNFNPAHLMHINECISNCVSVPDILMIKCLIITQIRAITVTSFF